MEPVYWYLLAYIIGSVVGYYLGHKQGLLIGIVSAIDSLIDGGYVRTKTDKDGEIEIIKLTWDEKNGVTETENS